MRIAVTSQNRRSITPHAGKCRHFWIYEVDAGRSLGRHSLEIPLAETFHAHHGELTSPLAQVNVLITGSLGTHLDAHLRAQGILPLVTDEVDPDQAVAAFLAKRLVTLGHAPGVCAEAHPEERNGQ